MVSTPSENRSVIAVGCLSIGLVHLLDLQGKFHETPYLGWLYLALIVASVVAAVGLLSGRDQRWMQLGAASALLPMIGYVLSRSVGLPRSAGDIGNWLEPLGLAALFVEGTVLLLIGAAMLAARTSADPAVNPRSRVGGGGQLPEPPLSDTSPGRGSALAPVGAESTPGAINCRMPAGLTAPVIDRPGW